MPEVAVPARAAAVLFDLDGTIADTAADMARALNRLLERHGRPVLPFARIRPQVSNGARAMIGIGFGLGPGDPGFAELRLEYLDLYAGDLCRETRPFPGIPELIAALESAGLRWGIVTNKPAWLTEPLLRRMTPEHRLAERAACIVSGDTAPRPKPHPDPLLHACGLIRREPAACWYVGDDARDIQAGRAAGMGTLGATWGYLGVASAPEDWGADGLVGHPLLVLDWLGARTHGWRPTAEPDDRS